MNAYGWMQVAVFTLLLLALTKPMGLYLASVLDPKGKTWFDPVFKPVERGLLALLGPAGKGEQGWGAYGLAVLGFSLAGLLFTYAILRLQGILPLNPQGFPGLTPDLAFNTAASFTTNTNWQSYGGESTMSYLSQMVALVLHNFTSAATGIAVAAAVIRGLAREKAATLGNFWVDVIRVHLYLLLPMALVFAVFLVSQGIPQNFSAAVKTAWPGQAAQVIAQGPVASQAAIKMLGTNGGGFFNANAAHPYENPNPLSNFFQIFSIFLIAAGLVWLLGQQLRQKSHGWTVWAAMAILFLAGYALCVAAEQAGNPRLVPAGVAASQGNWEGKEARFGIASSCLFATVTTDASCGAVNSMHESYTPLGGLVPLFNMQLSEVIFGGVGAGLYGMVVYIVLAVFIAGLMVGRTPEYLGKKIESYEVKMAMIACLVFAAGILLGTAAACSSAWGKAGLANAGPHGFTEMLYAFSEALANNGSAFAGLSANTPQYNTALGIAMLAGRFWMLLPVLALAGSMAAKGRVAQSAGSFPVSGSTFLLLLLGTLLIVGALTFLPALALGPIVEHFLLHSSAPLL
jgi:K+-transporting ATPase ATPase A chain